MRSRARSVAVSAAAESADNRFINRTLLVRIAMIAANHRYCSPKNQEALPARLGE